MIRTLVIAVCVFTVLSLPADSQAAAQDQPQPQAEEPAIKSPSDITPPQTAEPQPAATGCSAQDPEPACCCKKRFIRRCHRRRGC